MSLAHRVLREGVKPSPTKEPQDHVPHVAVQGAGFILDWRRAKSKKVRPYREGLSFACDLAGCYGGGDLKRKGDLVITAKAVTFPNYWMF